jgi:hypothetical protein
VGQNTHFGLLAIHLIKVSHPSEHIVLKFTELERKENQMRSSAQRR